MGTFKVFRFNSFGLFVDFSNNKKHAEFFLTERLLLKKCCCINENFTKIIVNPDNINKILKIENLIETLVPSIVNNLKFNEKPQPNRRNFLTNLSNYRQSLITRTILF